MASSYVQAQVTWSAAAFISANSASRFDSDVVSLNVECYEAALTISADNSGTPAAGDVLDVYLRFTTGDILGDSGDDFDTDEHSMYLGRLDTVAANTPGEDPVRRTFQIPSVPQKFKVSVVAPQGATRAITVRARVEEHRVA
jgi:hypothetical protein